MIDKKFIQEKVNLIARDLERLKNYSSFTFDEAAKDFARYAIVKNLLMESIGRGLDINSHLIAELANSTTDSPKYYRDTFLALIEFKILPKGFAEKISGSAGFRNAIVHQYNNLDKQKIFKTIGEAIDQYSKYCQYILDFLTTIED